MTNLEALRLQSSFAKNVPDGVLAFQLDNHDLNATDEYSKVNMKQLDLALAGLLLFIATQPESIKELDYQITNVSAADLLAIRRGLLARWGVEDELGRQPTITSKTELW